MREVHLAAYQPQYYRTSKLMQAVNAAAEKEFSRLWQAVAGVETETRITTANEEWIGIWEKSVGLADGTDLSLEQRRSRVLARLRQVDTTTLERIRIIVESYARGEVEVIENYQAYTVAIKFVSRIGRPDNIDSIIEQLERIMPAHLAVNYEYKYRTWRDVLATGKSWRELYNAGHTWDDIMNKEEL